MELSGSDVERVHARMKGAEKWHFSLKIADFCSKRLKFITPYFHGLAEILAKFVSTQRRDKAHAGHQPFSD